VTVKTRKKPTTRKQKPSTAKPDLVDVPTGPTLVAPLKADMLRMVMSIIDNANVKGSDAGSILILKQELARVAGVQTQPPAK